MNRAVFLDRDGVINRAVTRDGRPFPPASLEKFEFLPGVVEAVAMLRHAGFRIIVATNQPDVGKGAQRREVVEAIHVHMQSVLPIDAVKVCYHTDENECACRKPKPGMLLEAAAEWSLDLSRSFMVGDRWSDIEAGRAAQCRTALIKNDYIERPAENPDAVFASLLEASAWIVAQRADER